MNLGLQGESGQEVAAQPQRPHPSGDKPIPRGRMAMHHGWLVHALKTSTAGSVGLCISIFSF